jgi:hypothetical protein
VDADAVAPLNGLDGIGIKQRWCAELFVLDRALADRDLGDPEMKVRRGGNRA